MTLVIGILSRTSELLSEVFTQNRISAIVTIDVEGRVKNAEVILREGSLDASEKEKVKQTLLKMPKWNPATVEGKRVFYKIVVSL